MTNILMIGAADSGKTTFLTAMYRHYRENWIQYTCVYSDEEARVALDLYAESQRKNNIYPPKTKTARKYEIYVNDQVIAGSMCLTDYSGDILTGKRTDKEQTALLREAIAQSDAAIIFLNTEKMRHGGSRWSDELMFVENCLANAVKTGRGSKYKVCILLTGAFNEKTVKDYRGYADVQRLMNELKANSDIEVRTECFYADGSYVPNMDGIIRFCYPAPKVTAPPPGSGAGGSGGTKDESQNTDSGISEDDKEGCGCILAIIFFIIWVSTML